MMTPAGADGVPDGMRELIGPAITAVYALRSDKIAGAEPHAYTAGRDAAVDAALAAAGIDPPEAPLWWEIVDLLFEAGAHAAAARAQLYAVPVLGDLLAAVREPAVQGLVGDTAYGAGSETVTQAFIRILTALSGDWPIMFAPTAFDVGHVRIAAIDLADVAPQGSPEAGRQTAAFYLLARHALTRHWWIGEDSLRDIPEPYRAWHAHRLRDIREAPKRLAFDEFHRTAGAPAVRAQVERDVREARKLRVRLSLASQRLEDFGGALTELANRYWILGAGGKAREIEALSGIFALSETLQDAIRYRLPGPGKDGAPVLLIAERCARALRATGRQHAGTGRTLGADHQPCRCGAAVASSGAAGAGRRPGRPGPGLPHGDRACPHRCRAWPPCGGGYPCRRHRGRRARPPRGGARACS